VDIWIYNEDFITIYIYIYTDVILNKKPNRKVFYQFAFAIFAIVNEILISKNCRVNG